MRLIISDEGLEYTVLNHIERYDLTNDQEFDQVWDVADAIDKTIAYVARDAMSHSTKGMFKVGDRVMAYNHKGEREGKGTVIKSTDKRLLNYIHVELDQGFNAYYRADLCRRLVPKK